ncbi:MAG: catalase-related domain-containing protein, partial [Sphingomonadaceae bacterium]|nr:catalase-related domain-containing protein [Sphingomonadaceae bacterium]
SFAATESEPKQRLRPESFADHYSQARQFFASQAPIEQKHIGDAIVFELSKVERPDIRARMVSHLRNIDATLAQTVADGLGLKELPDAAVAARPTKTDLAVSDALSIVKRGPPGFKGRKLGILATDGADAAIFNALVKAVDAAGALYEVIAPKIAGVTLSDGTAVAARHKIDGGPSVLFDAVAVLPSAAGAQLLAGDAAAKDFVTDAFAHCKFIGVGREAASLFEKAGIADDLDDACLPLGKAADASEFIKACGALRYWPRELEVDLDAKPETPKKR